VQIDGGRIGSCKRLHGGRLWRPVLLRPGTPITEMRVERRERRKPGQLRLLRGDERAVGALALGAFRERAEAAMQLTEDRHLDRKRAGMVDALSGPERAEPFPDLRRPQERPSRFALRKLRYRLDVEVDRVLEQTGERAVGADFPWRVPERMERVHADEGRAVRSGPPGDAGEIGEVTDSLVALAHDRVQL